MGDDEKKGEVSNAVLAPGGLSIAQFVIQQLLAGLEVRVEIYGQPYTGHVHRLNFAKGSKYVFANVVIEELDIYLQVSIHDDGSVNIMPNQPDDD